MKPIVAIVGRPNVGKSTLFNALARKNIALVDDVPGVTRDRNYVDVDWEQWSFTLVDTGGFDFGTDDDIAHLVQEQVQMAVEEADLIVFLMDGKAGMQHGDQEIARMLRRYEKPVVYAVNKVESRHDEESLPEFYRLGAENLAALSAKHRQGLTELLEEICSRISEYASEESNRDEIVVSIIGRPNVGKSSIINTMLGRRRLMVSHKAGTTRDSVDSLIRYHNKTIRFIDTAGIRRKSRIGYSLERYCVFQALRSINRSAICILVIDATQGVNTQDAKLAAEIFERHKGCILAVNKWDLIAKDTTTFNAYQAGIRSKLAFMDFAPMVTLSALTGHRVRKLLDAVLEINLSYVKRVPTAAVNKAMQEICAHTPPPRGRGSIPKIYYLTQADTSPPTFKLFTNKPESFPPHYRRYLERSLRERFGFFGTPLRLKIAQKTGLDMTER